MLSQIFYDDNTNIEQSFDIYYPSSSVITTNDITTSTTTTTTSTSNDPSSSFPLFVFIHGGLWVSRDKSDYAGFGRYFATRGYAVAVVNYRLARSDGAQPVRLLEHTFDVAAALRHLHTHAASLRLDVASGITLCGHSCGAHMAALFSLQPKRFGVETLPLKNFIGIEGLYDLARFADDFPSWESELYVSWTSSRSNWTSPQTEPIEAGVVNNSANWMVIHSPSDQYVNMIQATNMVAKLLTKFSNVQLEDKQPGNHFDAVNTVDIDLRVGSPAECLVETINRFLNASTTTIAPTRTTTTTTPTTQTFSLSTSATSTTTTTTSQQTLFISILLLVLLLLI